MRVGARVRFTGSGSGFGFGVGFRFELEPAHAVLGLDRAVDAAGLLVRVGWGVGVRVRVSYP